MPGSPLSPFPLLVALLAGASAAVAPPEAPRTVAPAPSPYTEVPLVEDSGRLLVPVRIAGHDSLVFILDTAAGGSVISPGTRDRLGIDPAAGETVQVSGASGVAGFLRVPLPPVSVGGEEVAGLSAVVTEMARFRHSAGPAYAGILGNDFLRAFDVEVDVPAGRLRLWRHGRGAAPVPRDAPAAVANLSSIPGFVMFDVAVGDTTARAILDSGARRSILNWRAAAGAGVSRGTPGMQVERAAGGMSGDTVESHRYRFERVGVGGLRFPELEMRISDLPVFRSVGLAERPAMIVGVDVMRTCRVFISYSEGRVHLCGSPAAA